MSSNVLFLVLVVLLLCFFSQHIASAQSSDNHDHTGSVADAESDAENRSDDLLTTVPLQGENDSTIYEGDSSFLKGSSLMMKKSKKIVLSNQPPLGDDASASNTDDIIEVDRHEILKVSNGKEGALESVEKESSSSGESFFSALLKSLFHSTAA